MSAKWHRSGDPPRVAPPLVASCKRPPPARCSTSDGAWYWQVSSASCAGLEKASQFGGGGGDLGAELAARGRA
jgi:hypothetical protein